MMIILIMTSTTCMDTASAFRRCRSWPGPGPGLARPLACPESMSIRIKDICVGIQHRGPPPLDRTGHLRDGLRFRGLVENPRIPASRHSLQHRSAPAGLHAQPSMDPGIPFQLANPHDREHSIFDALHCFFIKITDTPRLSIAF